MGGFDSSEDEKDNQIQKKNNFDSSQSKSKSKSVEKNNHSKSRSGSRDRKKKSKKHRSSRSDSRDHKKKSKKHKSHHKKDKKKKKYSRDRSRSKDRYDRGDRDRYNRDKYDRDRYDRDRKRNRSNDRKDERWDSNDRSRSRSPLQYFQKNFKSNTQKQYQNTSLKDQQGNNVNTDEFYFDGFQYVPKNNKDPNVMMVTKKMRLIQITELPLEFGVTSDSLKKFICDYMIKYYLNDNSDPVLAVEIDPISKSAIVEFSTVQETSNFYKIKQLKLFSKYCPLIRLGDTMYGGTNSLVNMIQNSNFSQNQQNNQLQQQLQSQGQNQQNEILDQPELINQLSQQQKETIIKQKVLESMKPELKILQSGKNLTTIKVIGYLNEQEAKKQTQKQWEQVQQKLDEFFKPYGEVDCSLIINPQKATPQIQLGWYFIQFLESKDAQEVFKKFYNQPVDNKKVKLEILEDDYFENHYKCLLYI